MFSKTRLHFLSMNQADKLYYYLDIHQEEEEGISMTKWKGRGKKQKKLDLFENGSLKSYDIVVYIAGWGLAAIKAS